MGAQPRPEDGAGLIARLRELERQLVAVQDDGPYTRDGFWYRPPKRGGEGVTDDLHWVYILAWAGGVYAGQTNNIVRRMMVDYPRRAPRGPRRIHGALRATPPDEWPTQEPIIAYPRIILPEDINRVEDVVIHWLRTRLAGLVLNDRGGNVRGRDYRREGAWVLERYGPISGARLRLY